MLKILKWIIIAIIIVAICTFLGYAFYVFASTTDISWIKEFTSWMEGLFI